MDKKEVAQLLKLNKLNFGYLYKDLPKEDLEQLLNNWTYQLKDIPRELGNSAFLLAQRERGSKPVDISSIFSAIDKINCKNEISTSELWELAVKTAYKIADNCTGYRYTATMEDGRTQGQYYRDKNASLFKSLPEPIRKWMGSTSAMVEMGRTPRYELEKFTRPRFMRELKGETVDKVMLGECDTLRIEE